MNPIKTSFMLIAAATQFSCGGQIKPNSLESGIVELVSWRVNDTEFQLDDVEYTSIKYKRWR